MGYPGKETGFRQPPAVYIPVGLAGIDHAGQLFRTDNVGLPLRQLRQSGWPRAADILRQIRENLP